MEQVSCDICASSLSHGFAERGVTGVGASGDGFMIVCCGGCGLLYVNPRPTRDEIGRYYQSKYYASAPARPGKKQENIGKRLSRNMKRWIREDYYGYPCLTNKALLRRIRKVLLFPEWLRRKCVGREALPYCGAGRLLDVGCGVGSNLRTFKEQGWDVWGIDMGENAVAQAREIVGDRVHLATLETSSFPRQSFDVIVFNHSLEHMFSPSLALEKAREILTERGLIVITVPNAASLEARVFGEHWRQWDVPRHLFHFEPATLTRLLEKVGFRVRRLNTGVGSVFFMGSLKSSWEARAGYPVPCSKILERLFIAPICLMLGHLGYGTEIIVYAKKE